MLALLGKRFFYPSLVNLVTAVSGTLHLLEQSHTINFRLLQFLLPQFPPKLQAFSKESP